MANEEVIKKIEEEIKNTETQVLHCQELNGPVSPENAIGRMSRMDAISNKSIYESGLRQAEEKLSNLKRVMEKSGDKDFGICLRCKQPIPVGRLMTRLESLYCFGCAR